ncbi:MAG: hypothetical protein IT380_29020 [Myxococcales bacterium]|nr:hypothetical protein [Myxococcales bacterium]
MSSSIRTLARNAAADRTITREEAQSLVNKAKADGKITSYEKSQLREALTQYKDLFAAGAADLVKPLLEPARPPAPGQVVNLDPTPSQRPVYLAADGSFTVHSNGAAPRTSLEKGDALYRAGELVDNAKENLFAGLPRELRQKAFDKLGPTLSTSNPSGFDDKQALQARASSGTVLLALLEASKEPELATPMLKAYEALVKAEPNQRLKENLIFHLSNSPAAQTGEAKKTADALMTQLAPLTPPYARWFANGNKTVKLDWQVGDEFLSGFRNNLTRSGWKETSAGSGVYQKTFNDPQHGETKFEIRTRLGSSNLLEKVGDKSVHIMGYDGHSNWGKNQTGSIKRAPSQPDGGDGQLFLSNLCVGKSQVDAMKEKFPNLQFTTTYGSSSVDTDIDALAKFISQRKGWDEITPYLDRVDGHWDRNNFVTPTSTLTREKMLDRDNDGQADYLDKHFNVSTFAVAEDTRREFRPVKQDRPSELLDGTKVGISAQVLNTVSEFNGVLKDVNEHSRVIAGGWFEPKAGEADVVKFEKVKGKDGQPEYRMTVNARYSHMSEEAMRATCVYELNRFLQSSGEQKLDAVDRKLLAVIGFAQSLDIDDSWRDDEVFTEFLGRYNLPAISRDDIQPLLDAEHHDYAGSQQMVDALKAKLPAGVLAELKKPEVGEPVRFL